jgi:hypothetical protein
MGTGFKGLKCFRMSTSVPFLTDVINNTLFPSSLSHSLPVIALYCRCFSSDCLYVNYILLHLPIVPGFVQSLYVPF